MHSQNIEMRLTGRRARFVFPFVNHQRFGMETGHTWGVICVIKVGIVRIGRNMHGTIHQIIIVMIMTVHHHHIITVLIETVHVYHTRGSTIIIQQTTTGTRASALVMKRIRWRVWFSTFSSALALTAYGS